MSREEGDYVYAPDLTNEQIQSFVDDCLATGEIDTVEESLMECARGQAYLFVTWDEDNDIYTYSEPYPEGRNVTEEYIGMSLKKGDYVFTEHLSIDQLKRFHADILAAGGESSTGATKAVPIFGWDRRDNTTYGWRDATSAVFHAAFNRDVTSRYTTARGETPMTTTNPFKAGDKVVPNGFRARPDGSQHKHGTNYTMERWERNKTVLTVENAFDISVRAGDGENTYSYHPAELRIALPQEVTRAEASVSAIPKIGTLIKWRNEVYMVASERPDSDGDIRITSVVNGNRSYLRVNGSTPSDFTVLGQIMPDGDLRPAAASPADDDPRTWKKGDVVECISNHVPYFTKGRRYILTADADSSDQVRIHTRDDDDDSAIRKAISFKKVS